MSNNTGKVSQIIGPVVDVVFDNNENELPNIYDSLEITRKNLNLARDVYYASEKKYSEGVGSNLEFHEKMGFVFNPHQVSDFSASENCAVKSFFSLKS